jgi:gliding motility-associated-like protein
MFRILLFLIFFVFGNVQAQVLINEVSASNRSNFADGFGEFEDWIELYNAGPGAADISNFFLSDNPALPSKWQIPAGTIIPAGGFRIFICSGRNQIVGELHTSFKLTQTSGETILFSDNGAALIDSYTLSPTLVNQSRGRYPDGGTWKVFVTPSPNTTNSAVAFDGYTATPTMSLAPGIYPSAQILTLSSPDPGVSIRYTLDGSEPGLADPVYTTPLNISGNTVVRARALAAAGSNLTAGFIENNSYFIGISHTIPIVSLISNEYTNLFNNSSPEIKTGIEYFNQAGVLQWESYGEADPHGNDSWAYPQKGVDFVVRDQYGYDDKIEYQIFPTKPRQEFQRIMFKAGASDNYPFSGAPNPSCHLRDAFVQSLAEKAGMHVDYRATDHCVIYINGEYWGVYEVREKVNDPDYTDYYWGQEEEDLDFLSFWGWLNVRYGSANDWNDLYAYIMANDLSVQANYNAVASRLDIASAIDYMIINTWSVNSDWISWNTMWWRGRGNPDVKWKYALWDMDNTFNLGQNFSGWDDMGFTADPCDLDNNSEFVNADAEMGHLNVFGRLMDNTDFKQRFVNRYAEMINTYLHCDVAIPHLDSIANHIAPEMPAQIARWGGTYAEWQSNLDFLRNQINGRCDYIENQGVVNCYDVSGPYDLTFDVSPANSGTIKFNELDITSYPWTGSYFGDVEGDIIATPAANYEFLYWEIHHNNLNSDTIVSLNSFMIGASDTIIAHFRLIETHQLTFIIEPAGSGTVSINGIGPASYPFTATYNEDFPISLSANPATNYEFVWYEANYHSFSPDSISINTFFLTDTTDTIIVHFKPIQTWFLTVLVDPPASGLVNIDGTWIQNYPESIEYFPNTNVTSDVFPNEAYLFSHWSLNELSLAFDSTNTLNGCIVDTSDTLTAHFLLKEVIPQTMYIPSSFTPNGDLLNDVFQCSHSETVLKGNVLIFDSWGQEIYKSENIDFQWDGTYQGSELPDGVYFYVLNYYLKKDYFQTAKGIITLYR